MPATTTAENELPRRAEATPSIAKTASGDFAIRCSGRLVCDCGRRIQAFDIEVDDGLAGLKLNCPACHANLLSVSP
jgi:hypothetical protein